MGNDVPWDGRHIETRDKSELCEDLDLLAVLGGKPSTEEGAEIIRQHKAGCHWCDRPGWGRSLIDIIIDRTSETATRLESIFGPITWTE